MKFMIILLYTGHWEAGMLKKLRPKLYVDSIYDIDFKMLKAKGFKGIIVDLDNTITEWNNPRLSQKMFVWFKEMGSNSLKPVIVSNNSESRVAEVAQQLQIPYTAKAKKPGVSAFKKAMAVIGTDSKQTVVIGDQLFTDILGGNRLNLFTVLVVPLNSKEFIGTRFMRIIERGLLRILMLDKA